jgi:hypothetical protein
LHSTGLYWQQWGTNIPSGYPSAHYACCICFNLDANRHIAITAGFKPGDTSIVNIYLGFAESGGFTWVKV